MRNVIEICLIIFICAGLGWIYVLSTLEPAKQYQRADPGAAALATAVDANSTQAALVDNVGFSQEGGVIRIVMDVSGSVRVRTGETQSPDRFFIDITPAYLNTSTTPQWWEVPSSSIKKIRIAQYDDTTVRVVLDGITSSGVEADHSSRTSRIVMRVAEPVRPPERLEEPALIARKALPIRMATGVRAESAISVMDFSKPRVYDESSNQIFTRRFSRIVIDAGHGGTDSGSIGPTGLMEKDLALDLSKRLKTLLESELGTEAVLTRNQDTFVALEDRTQIANAEHADLFISIHANSSPQKTVQGVETFFLKIGSGSRDALATASRENASYQKRIGDLPDLLSTIASNDKTEESRRLAEYVQTALSQSKERRSRGVHEAPLAVLIGARMPAVLVEVSYISNPEEERRLKIPEYREQIAVSLYRAIKSYAETSKLATTLR